MWTSNGFVPFNVGGIKTVSEFLSSVKEGTEFWELGTWYGEPNDINRFIYHGPDLDDDHMGVAGHWIKVTMVWMDTKKHSYTNTIESLIAPYHGVYLSETDALNALWLAKEIWYLNKELQRESADMRMWNDLMDHLDEYSYEDDEETYSKTD